MNKARIDSMQITASGTMRGLTREAATETRDAARETRDAAAEIREAVRDDDGPRRN